MISVVVGYVLLGIGMAAMLAVIVYLFCLMLSMFEDEPEDDIENKYFLAAI
jgi:hypothetical protein